MQILVQVATKSAITTSNCIHTICQFIGGTERIRNLTIEVLETIVITVPEVGPSIVMEGISAWARTTGEEFRFLPIMTCLELATDKEIKVPPTGSLLPGLPCLTNPRVDDDDDDDQQRLCMSLINALVDSIEDLEDRFSLRTEFMRMGFQDTLSVCVCRYPPLLTTLITAIP